MFCRSGCWWLAAAQVALRWIAQQGIAVATSPGGRQDFIDEDLDLGSFKLSDGEMEVLSHM